MRGWLTNYKNKNQELHNLCEQLSECEEQLNQAQEELNEHRLSLRAVKDHKRDSNVWKDTQPELIDELIKEINAIKVSVMKDC